MLILETIKNQQMVLHFLVIGCAKHAQSLREHPDVNFVRVIQPDNYDPEELNTFENFSTIFVEDFKKMFDIL